VALRILIICAVAAVVCAGYSTAHAVDKTPKEKAALARQVRMLLKDNCYRCHGDPEFKASGGVNYILNHKRVVSKLVDLKDPDKSELYTIMNDGKMPRVQSETTGKFVNKKLPQEQVDLVLEWIKAGAPAWAEPVKWQKVPDVTVPYTNLCEGPDGKLLCISLRADGDKTFVYDFKEWKLLDGPGPTAAAQMAFDSKRKVVVAFDLQTQRTWEFASKWTEVKTKASPGKREHAQVACDSGRGVVVLYGGVATGGSNLADTWEYDGKDWTSIATTGKPAAGAGCMAYDPRNKVCVMHCGGLDETWLYDAKDWVKKTTATSPGARNYAGSCWDPFGQRVLLYGGSKDGAVNHELWGFVGDDWILIDTEGDLPKQNGAFIYYNAARKKLYHCAGTMHTLELN
jgi:hypothetical protein